MLNPNALGLLPTVAAAGTELAESEEPEVVASIAHRTLGMCIPAARVVNRLPNRNILSGTPFFLLSALF